MMVRFSIAIASCVAIPRLQHTLLATRDKHDMSEAGDEAI
jgi:hypothetical protein